MSFEKPIQLNSIPASEIRAITLLGEGSYGQVYKATYQTTIVAVKCLYIDANTNLDDLKQKLDREASLMAMCQSPQIVKPHGICLDNGYSLVMEYLPKGSLYSVLHNPKEYLRWNIRWEIALDITKGLSYLHNINVVHCDIKSENIVLDHSYHAKITDFGFSNFENKITKRVGTLQWMAPELLKKKAVPNKKSDIYSCGVLLWEIASRRVPFENANDTRKLCKQIEKGEKEKIPVECPENYKKVILACWQNHEHRQAISTITDILEKTKPKNYEEYLSQSVNFLQLKANEGDAISQFDLAKCYAHGFGVNQDATKAVKYYQLSANQGFIAAQCDLGTCYLIGFGVNRNLFLARKYFEFAANQGCPDGQFNLGVCYENGFGVEKELAFAMKYYKLAAKAGHLIAKTNLERLLHHYPELEYQSIITFPLSFFSTPTIPTTSTEKNFNNTENQYHHM